MNQVDRFQALIRHPDYHSDPRLADMLRLGDMWNPFTTLFSPSRNTFRLNECVPAWIKHHDFLRVWGLKRPVDPDNPEEIAAALEALHAGNDSIFEDDFRGYEMYEYQGKPDQHPERYLTIAVDLGCPNEELKEFFVATINKKRNELGINRTQMKEHLADPWKVWDLERLHGKTYSDIARAIDGTARKPADDPEVKASIERVRRAYLKASAMIDEVGRRRKTAVTEEIMERQLAILSPMMAVVVDCLVKGVPATDAMFDSAFQAWPPTPTEQHPLP